MKTVYGVEHRELGGEELDELYKCVESIARIHDRDEQLLIVEMEEASEAIHDLFEQKSIFEDSYHLYKMNCDSINTFNTDYGFATDSGDIYLYKELTVPFQFHIENEQGKMAMLQMKEHIIAEENGDIPVYFADRQHEELILRIASAYQVSVTIL